MNERPRWSTGKYAVIGRITPRIRPWPSNIGQNRDIYFRVRNGNNNDLLTNKRFQTPREAREWAEANGYEVRYTGANPNYEEVK